MSLLAYVETYGCQMNVADTEMVLGLLQGAGYARTHDPAVADVILINTCAVREKAVERVWGRARTLAAYVQRRQLFPWGRRIEIARHIGEPLRQKFQLPPGTDLDMLLCGLYRRAFIADRNNIPRTWMDHGIWPLYTTLGVLV